MSDATLKCIFCNITSDRIICECDKSIAVRDNFPVTPFHTLIIPKRHCRTFFELTYGELGDMYTLAMQMKQLIIKFDPTVRGFNIGFNVEAEGGQTVMHCHMHLIPRRTGDVVNARGGVRNIIPGKGDYKPNE